MDIGQAQTEHSDSDAEFCAHLFPTLGSAHTRFKIWIKVLWFSF